MNQAIVEARLREIFSTVLDLPENVINGDLTSRDCTKWDSLAHIHMVSAIDQEFSVTLSFERQMDIKSFSDAVNVVQELLLARECAAHHTAPPGVTTRTTPS
jgi:acyl carrier protein